MIVDLEEREEKATFDLKGGGKLHLRLLSADDIKSMRKACMKKVVEYPLLDGKYQRFEDQDFDGDLWQEMLSDLTIIGWDDLFDRNEKAIPVTKENKLLLMTRVPEFTEAYMAGMKVLKDAESARQGQSEKNLPTGQIG